MAPDAAAEGVCGAACVSVLYCVATALLHPCLNAPFSLPVPCGAFLCQGYALFKHMTVAQNITFGPRMRKMGLDLDAK
jgi:hypothetical protein